MSSRDEILTDFQACTGIEDTDVAICLLQDHNWDLITAINQVLPQESQTLPSEAGRSEAFTSTGTGSGPSTVNNVNPRDLFGIDRASKSFLEDAVHFPIAGGSNGVIHRSSGSGSSGSKVSLSSDFLKGKSGSNGIRKGGSKAGSSKAKDIEFQILNSETGQELNVDLAECETLDTLRTLIHAHFDIPPCQQRITGWPLETEPSDGAKFGSLHLPHTVHLVLSTTVTGMDFSTSTGNDAVPSSSKSEEKHRLIIHDEAKDETYTIDFEGSKNVRGVKEDVSHASDIPVRLQVWNGWPVGTTDSMTLSSCGLDKPFHTLTVKKQVSAPTSSADISKKMMELGDGSETSSDVEDLTESYPLEGDEDFFTPEASTTPQRFLLPEGVTGETEGSIIFADNFSMRYGACHPMFYHGSLEDAVKEACGQPAKNRKLLAIYLHHDGSVVSNVFCQNILCNESVVSYLTNNFIIWGWDVTNESNRQMLLSAANKNFGAPGVSTIRSIERERYPVIIIVSRIRAVTEICNVIYGPSAVTVDEVMGNLMTSSELYQSTRQADIRDEEEREARDRVKREQDEAYELSLIADRAKDEARKALEQQKMNEEMQLQAAARQAQMLRDQIASTLPPEPDVNCTDPVCSLKCRLPGGKIISRRFLQSTTLNILFDYLFTQGFSSEQYRFLTTYPKRDLSGCPPQSEMKNVFSPQDTLIVEER